MPQFFQILRALHITAGMTGLGAFWVPVVAKKGGRVHIGGGRTFAICMSVVIVSALLMSALEFFIPLRIRPEIAHAPNSVQIVASLRVFAVFLAYLAGVTLASLWQGIRVLRSPERPRLAPTPFNITLNTVVALSGVAILIIGLRERSAVLLALSPLGPLLAGGNLRYILAPAKTRMAWWYEHLSSMMGTGIAAYTAFLVFGGRRIAPALYGNQFRVVFWILPTIIGVPAITATVAYYKRKFREDDRSTKPRAASA